MTCLPSDCALFEMTLRLVWAWAMFFSASLQPLFVQELADTLPTPICYHVEDLGKFFWSLEYFYDSLTTALSSEAAAEPSQPTPTPVPELNKFTKSVHSRLSQADAKELLGENYMHMKPANPRFGGEIFKQNNVFMVIYF